MIALALCAALLASIFPVLALDVYEVQSDTSAILFSSAYDVATADVTSTELEVTLQKFLIYDDTSAAEFLYKLYSYLATIRNSIVSPSSSSPFWSYGSYLSQSGDAVTPSGYMSTAEIVRQGFVGVDYEFETLKSYLIAIDDSIKANDNSASLSDIFSAVQSVDASVVSVISSVNSVNSSVGDVETAVDWVYSAVGSVETAVGDVETAVGEIGIAVGDVEAAIGRVETAVGEVETAVGDVETAVGGVETAVSSGFTTMGSTMRELIVGTSSPFRLEAATYLAYDGFDFSGSDARNLDFIVNSGFRGLGALLRVPAGMYQLDRNGNVITSTAGQSISSVMRQGLMGLAAQQRVDAGFIQLDRFGNATVSSEATTISSLMRQGLLGLASQQRVDAGYLQLDRFGQATVSSEDTTISSLMRQGFLGVRSLVSGSEADNIYSGSLVDNENKTSTFTATGLGPMLSKYLGEIQNDTGILSYVFASPLDLEMKENSEDNMGSVNDTFLSPDSTSGVKADNITDIGAASDSIQALGNTGVSPAQAFEQMGNSDLFAFFSEACANDLNTTVSTFASDPSQEIVTDYYVQSRIEFFNIIGEEGDE